MDPAGAEHLKSNTTKVLKMDNSSNRIRVWCVGQVVLLVACCLLPVVLKIGLGFWCVGQVVLLVACCLLLVC